VVRRSLPAGESWRQAVARVTGFLADLPPGWDRQRVLMIGHLATRSALDHQLLGIALEDLVEADFGWPEGWDYELS
jgi:2,3-bisphosphoglycerate-dependent phosphoglycerate mutase